MLAQKEFAVFINCIINYSGNLKKQNQILKPVTDFYKNMT